MGFFAHHVLGTKITLPEIQRPGGAPQPGHVALVFFFFFDVGVVTFTVRPPTDRRSVESPPLREILLARMSAGFAIRARDVSSHMPQRQDCSSWRFLGAQPGQTGPLMYLRNQ